MPRGDQSVPAVTFRTWTVVVDKENRIRIPIEIAEYVTWLRPKDDRGECVLVRGPWGGFQAIPLMAYQKLAEPFIEASRTTTPEALESGDRWIEAVRYLATAWQISISVEASQVRFTVPEALRRAELLPGAEGRAVVFGFGEILEIWPAREWYEHVRETSKLKSQLFSAALEDLRQR
jgi:DNA-binding transcriptional regulator/RsmH inhibitor MraZ